MITNIHRDGFNIKGNSAKYNWSTPVAVSADPQMNGPAAIQGDICEVSANETVAVTMTLAQRTVVGCSFSSADIDRAPFRVKASIALVGEDDIKHSGLIMVGFAPAAPTGSNDTINGARFIPFEKEFNDLLLIEPEIEGQTYHTRPIAIAVGFVADSALTNVNVFGHLSVQNLRTKPPTMRNAVS